MKKIYNRPIVITGPSGAGKTELINYICEKYNNFAEASGYTTRKRRDTDNNNIHSITRNEFEELIKDNGLIEYCLYEGNYYGVPKSEFNKLKEYNLIFNVGYSSAKVIKEIYTETIMIYLLPPDKQELIRRMGDRSIERYYLGIDETTKNAKYYDYLLISKTNKLDETCNDFLEIIEQNKNGIKSNFIMKNNDKFIKDFYR